MANIVKCMVVAFLFIPILAFGEEAVKIIEITDPGAVVLEGDEFLSFLLNSTGGMKGLGILAIVGVVAQILMKALQTSFLGKLAGKWRLLAVYGLNLIGGVIGLAISGVAWPVALLHSNSLAGFSILGHQVYKQFMVKKD